MIYLEIVFWLSLFIVFYSYLGYGMFLWVYLKIRDLLIHKKIYGVSSMSFEPEVTMIIATYNEEEIIEKKIQNCFSLDYPRSKIRFLVVADGSTDNTLKIAGQFSEIDLWFEPERHGKSAAINRVMPHVTTPVTIFTDANTFLNKDCVKNIVKHYADLGVGAVSGEKKVFNENKTETTAGAGEGLYWKYESFLKKLDSRFYSVVGAAGELFSIRTRLYEPVDKKILLDDFIISMNICIMGYRVMYEPQAYATELPSFSLKEEQKRKIRIAAGGFQSMLILKKLLNIFKFGKLSFQYISHRVLRWLICPLLLPIILICNCILIVSDGDVVYNLVLTGQYIFYFMAILGWLFAKKNIKIPMLYIAYYFTFMNMAMYFGFQRFVQKKQSVLWEKAKRATNTTAT